ncbi:MAG: hypothetical protein K2X61_08175 [Caulobacteraceae bacterium]|nr:hypothetical protein [Caulobacteraceae bacterium]
MVRALLAGHKTQTRRVVKPYTKWADRFPICKPAGMAADHQVWWWDGEHQNVGVSQACRYGAPGDRLWVRETWCEADTASGYSYAADFAHDTRGFGWRPSIHMPRTASRLTLAVTDIRVERLHAITEADAEAEGVREPSIGPIHMVSPERCGQIDREKAPALFLWEMLWRSINGADSWNANPWVWAVTFEVVR